MNKKQRMYLGFLESLKTPKTKAVIESVKKAYVMLECGDNCEGAQCESDEEGVSDNYLVEDVGDYGPNGEYGMEPSMEYDPDVPDFDEEGEPVGVDDYMRRARGMDPAGSADDLDTDYESMADDLLSKYGY